MENKYYIPEISEFHVGFEIIIIGQNKNGFDDIKEICLCEQNILNYKYSALVKYLDEKDIISLGFDIIIKDQYQKNDFRLLIDDELFIQIIKDDEFVFQGTIKNKSELKKLLIQLGIYETTTK